MKQYKIWLLHKLKIWPETKIWSWARIDELHELKFGGEWWFDHMKDFENFQLIWICLASISSTKASLRQELWKIAQEYLLGKLSRILAWGNYMDRKRCPKSLGSIKQYNSTSFAKCHLGQNRKRIIGGLFLNMAMKYFAIFEQDRTQKIHENYLGILGVR